MPRLRSGASARVARERGGCAMNSSEVHGLVDVGRLTRIRSTGRNPGRCPGTFCPRRACTSRRRLVVVAGRGQHVVAHAALRKKTRSGAVGRRTRGKRRGGCSRRSRSACRCPPRPAEKRGRARWGGRTRGKRRGGWPDDRRGSCSRSRSACRRRRRPAEENEVGSGGEGGRGANAEGVAVAVDNNRVVALLALRKKTRSGAVPGRVDARHT